MDPEIQSIDDHFPFSNKKSHFYNSSQQNFLIFHSTCQWNFLKDSTFLLFFLIILWNPLFQKLQTYYLIHYVNLQTNCTEIRKYGLIRSLKITLTISFIVKRSKLKNNLTFVQENFSKTKQWLGHFFKLNLDKLFLKT